MAEKMAAQDCTQLPRGTTTRRQVLTSQLRKTKICMYHLQGTCHFGAGCAFAHACAELQASPDLRKTRLCRAFEAGECEEEDCEFAHGQTELRSTGLFYKRTLCVWAERGKCRNGATCRFAHGKEELRSDARPAAAAAKAKGNQRGRGGPAQHRQKAFSDPAKPTSFGMDEPMKVSLSAPPRDASGPGGDHAAGVPLRVPLLAVLPGGAASEGQALELKAKLESLKNQLSSLALQFGALNEVGPKDVLPPGLDCSALFPESFDRWNMIKDGGELLGAWSGRGDGAEEEDGVELLGDWSRRSSPSAL